MNKIHIWTKQCNDGDILAEDINNEKGVPLVVKNTVLNQYIRDKLIIMNVSKVWIYHTSKIDTNNRKSIKKSIVEENYKEAVFEIRNFLQQLSTGVEVDYKKILKISDIIFNSVNESNEVIEYLENLKNTDEYTYTHCVNVAFYSMLIGKWISLPKSKIQEVIQSGLLHDIGKMKVPLDILNKKGKLSQEEFEEIKKHSLHGYELISDNSYINESIKKAVLSHHERYDGSGYPYGLQGESIELYARIVGIADVFDAMTQNRVYKKKVSPFEAFKMFLAGGVSIFDAKILNAFLSNLSTYYVGMKVLLNNEMHGKIVYIPPQNIVCPIVKVGSEYIDLSVTNGYTIELEDEIR